MRTTPMASAVTPTSRSTKTGPVGGAAFVLAPSITAFADFIVPRIFITLCVSIIRIANYVGPGYSSRRTSGIPDT